MAPTQVPNLFKSSHTTAANRDTLQYCTESKPGPDQCCNNLSNNWLLVSLLANLDAHLETLRANGTPSWSGWLHDHITRNFIITYHYCTSTYLHAIANSFVWKLLPRIPSGVSGLAGRQRKAATRKRHVKMNIYTVYIYIYIDTHKPSNIYIYTCNIHQYTAIKSSDAFGTQNQRVSSFQQKITLPKSTNRCEQSMFFILCHSIRRWIPQHWNCKQAQKQIRTGACSASIGKRWRAPPHSACRKFAG